MTFDNQSLRPGTVIHGPQLNYKVIKKLGQGGFGITYLVEAQVKIGNIVVPVRFALKEHFISSLCTRDAATQHVTVSGPASVEVQKSMRSFIKEASRLQELDFSHRNIVKINEVFEANSTAYYVMEYLEGETLQSFVEREGPLTFEQASYFLRPVAEAVAELHAKRLTHYDIKPGNIILTTDEDGSRRAVLIDFGLSKHYDHEGHATSTVSSGGYSPGYSPVEQYAGIKTFTPQADVYALAATLWFCLKGEAPAESVLGPVNSIDTDLADVASPRLIEAMRHAMTVLSDQRTPDAAAFVREVFDGAPAEAQSRVTQRRPVTTP
ncbi:MAG: serine/threonine protein kinase, partial [Muribaculaceae bacterium]|nr:serine/threonine protein kinase [Muribaculaceae bacterium]